MPLAPRKPRKPRRSYFEAEWQAGGVYHVFSSAVHLNRLFNTPADYRIFVESIRDRLPIFADIFAYALIPNHFHLALRLLSEEDLRRNLQLKTSRLNVKEAQWLDGVLPYRQLIGDYWAAFFTKYAYNFNQRHSRRGSLFNQTIRRIRVRNDLISRRLIMYIHTNEVKHQIIDQYTNSGLRTSFAYYLSTRASQWLATEAVLDRFGGLDNFLLAHQQYIMKYSAALSTFDEQLYFHPPFEASQVAPAMPFLHDI